VGPYSVSLQGRYRNESIINTTWIEGVDVDDNTVPSYTFWNMALNYNGETASGAAWRLGLNIQNVFDKGPGQVQNVSTRFAIQSFTGDLYGRRYNLNFNYSF
jgi:outer membrane receptor protein involved in Fe transport